MSRVGSCFGPERVKKDDDDHKTSPARGWQTTLLLSTTAAVALVGLVAAFRAKAAFMPGTPLTGMGLLGGGGEACPKPEGMWIDPHRALAMLNHSKWQARNISWNILPDGHPIHHYDSCTYFLFACISG